MIAIDLCKQQELDADPKQYQTLIFLEIQTKQERQQYFILEEPKENYFRVLNQNYLILKLITKISNKNETGVTLRLPSKKVGESINEGNFPQKLLLTDR